MGLGRHEPCEGLRSSVSSSAQRAPAVRNVNRAPALLFSLVLGVAAFSSCGGPRADDGESANATELELLNVSYDPTRELWRDLNERFIAHYQQESGVALTINQSHGGSTT